MTFELEFALDDGRVVFVVGTVEVLYEDGRPHIEDLTVESTVMLYPDESEEFLDMDWNEPDLERRLCEEIYDDIERRAA